MKFESPYLVDGLVEFNEDRSECKIVLASNAGNPLTAQEILDAVADILLEYYAIDPTELRMPDEAYDS